jgi:hypothetical protein
MIAAPDEGIGAMIPDLKKLVVRPVAMTLFLCAASTSKGLTWRSTRRYKPSLFARVFPVPMESEREKL